MCLSLWEDMALGDICDCFPCMPNTCISLLPVHTQESLKVFDVTFFVEIFWKTFLIISYLTRYHYSNAFFHLRFATPPEQLSITIAAFKGFLHLSEIGCFINVCGKWSLTYVKS